MNRMMPCLWIAWAIVSPAQGGVPEVVEFVTDDRVTIVGDFHAQSKAPSPAVILMHMNRADRSTWRPLIPKLVEAGFAVLAIDLRGHGESIRPASMNLAHDVENRNEALYNAMHRDAAAARVFLSKQPKIDMSRLAIVGASIGCSIGIDYGSRDRSVDVVVCMTPGDKYLGVDSMAHIAKYGARPLLLLATEDERAAADKLVGANALATVRIVGPGRVHGTHMFGKIAGIEDQIVSFIRDNIGDGGAAAKVVADVEGNSYVAVGSKEHMAINPDRVIWFSSVEEARTRGLTGSESPHDGRIQDYESTPKP